MTGIMDVYTSFHVILKLYIAVCAFAYLHCNNIYMYKCIHACYNCSAPLLVYRLQENSSNATERSQQRNSIKRLISQTIYPILQSPSTMLSTAMKPCLPLRMHLTKP